MKGAGNSETVSSSTFSLLRKKENNAINQPAVAMFTLTIPGISERVASRTRTANSPPGALLAGNRLDLLRRLQRGEYAAQGQQCGQTENRQFLRVHGIRLPPNIIANYYTTGNKFLDVSLTTLSGTIPFIRPETSSRVRFCMLL